VLWWPSQRLRSTGAKRNGSGHAKKRKHRSVILLEIETARMRHAWARAEVNRGEPSPALVKSLQESLEELRTLKSLLARTERRSVRRPGHGLTELRHGQGRSEWRIAESAHLKQFAVLANRMVGANRGTVSMPGTQSGRVSNSPWEAGRVGGSAHVQIRHALAQERQSGLGSRAEMLLTSDLNPCTAGLGYCGHQNSIQIP
jgi:hypothetical protein